MHFFVSYSRSIKNDLRPLVDVLRAAGHEVWWDADIPVMSDWWATILDHIEQCQVFIFVVSEKAVQSPYCLAELKYATDRNRPILPFVIDDHTGYTIPPEVTPMRNQWFVYDGDATRALATITADIQKIRWEIHQDRPHTRPAEPGKGAGSVIRVFQQAVSLAENGHIDEAIRRFQNVASLDFTEWGEECEVKIRQLQAYVEIAEYADHPATMVRAKSKWTAYLDRLSSHSFPAEFDPLNVRDRVDKHTGRARIPETPVSVPAPQPGRKSSLEILPQPFAWIKIPAGKVTLITEKGWAKNYVPEGKSRTFDVPVFEIAKYPVTNAQFRLFVDAHGYSQRQWWTDAGWEAREQGIGWDGSKWVPTGKPWTEPRFWNDNKWNLPDYPVVGVSWYEGVAFCQWLSDVTRETIMLPTEQQWQRAAQGDTNWAYPWGDKFDRAKCNFNTSGTTSVTEYKGKGKGDSPFGVVDMSGNVWEWCLTTYESGSTDLAGTDVRVLRGGSWNYDIETLLRAVYRNWDLPGSRSNDRGFRVARSLF